jgi:hypothetical protein
MSSQWKKIAATLTTAALLSVGTQQVLAQDHGHAHEAAAPAKLTLNKGQKWATDANLRQGMNRIREAMAADLPAIHGGKATVKQYRALAQKTNEQISFMVQTCKLEPEADAMLHLLLADIIAGADAMRDKGVGEARLGAEKIVQALEDYGVYFSHPGWRGLTPSR